MWLYTSYAWQPHRSVASKNGDLRYHGPKYKVLDVTSGSALASPLIAPLSSAAMLAPARSARNADAEPAPFAIRTEYSFNPIRRARGTYAPAPLPLARQPACPLA